MQLRIRAAGSQVVAHDSMSSGLSPRSPRPRLRIEVPSFGNIVSGRGDAIARLPISAVHPTELYEVLRDMCDIEQGKILLLRHRQSGLMYIAKVLKTHLVINNRSIIGEPIQDNALREIDLLRLLSSPGHPSVISLIETIVSANHIWIMLEYAPHGDLQQLHASGNATRPRVHRYARQLVSAIQYMHERHVAHLDLSLENVLLGCEDIVKICDFGAGVNVAAGIQLHGRHGKLPYMAPEVLHSTSEERFDPFPADMWSMGVILFSLLFNVNPFERHNMQDAMIDIIYKNGVSGLRQLSGQQNMDDDVLFDFLAGFLCPVSQRFTAATALQHVWLGGAPADDDLSIQHNVS